MNGYYLLLDYIKSLLDADVDCNTVTTGVDLSSTDLNRKDIYALAHIEANDGTFLDNVIQINLELFSLDQVDFSKEIENGQKFIGNDNEQDVYNTTLYVLRRVYNKLSVSDGISILGDANIQKTERVENNLIGWSMTLTVEISDSVMRFC